MRPSGIPADNNAMAMLYGSSPVAQPALQTLKKGPVFGSDSRASERRCSG